jgi:Pyruvate kinase, barrel domain
MIFWCSPRTSILHVDVSLQLEYLTIQLLEFSSCTTYLSSVHITIPASHFFVITTIKMKILFVALNLALCSLSASAFAPRALFVHRSAPLQAATLSSTNGAVNKASPDFPTVAAVPKVAQRWRKSTKQLITLGPASSNKEMIEKLFLAGADVFRLNFSHGSQEQKLELLKIIREVEEKYSHPIAILGDLQGPKLRVSVLFDDSLHVS